MLDTKRTSTMSRQSFMQFRLNKGKQSRVMDEFSFTLDDEIHKSRNDLPHTPRSGRISTVSTSTLSTYFSSG